MIIAALFVCLVVVVSGWYLNAAIKTVYHNLVGSHPYAFLNVFKTEMEKVRQSATGKNGLSDIKVKCRPVTRAGKLLGPQSVLRRLITSIASMNLKGHDSEALLNDIEYEKIPKYRKILRKFVLKFAAGHLFLVGLIGFVLYLDGFATDWVTYPIVMASAWFAVKLVTHYCTVYECYRDLRRFPLYSREYAYVIEKAGLPAPYLQAIKDGIAPPKNEEVSS